MRPRPLFVSGVVIGFALGLSFAAAASLAVADEPTVTLRNGPLDGWAVTRDDEALLCTDPMVFVRARQIECP